MKNIEKKQYTSCTVKILMLENDDVLTAISGVSAGGNRANFLIDLDEEFN